MGLVVLVADANMEALIVSLLGRMHLVERDPTIHKIDVIQVIRHPHRDPGIYSNSVPFVAEYVRDPDNKLLVVLDYEFARPKELNTAMAVQSKIIADLVASGWADRSKVIVSVPEIDGWLWVKRQTMRSILKSTKDAPDDLDKWLMDRGYEFDTNNKPIRPKEALEEILRYVKKPRSSSLYAEIGAKASYIGCVDGAFLELHQQILDWYRME